jgi:hypothetical protein
VGAAFLDPFQFLGDDAPTVSTERTTLEFALQLHEILLNSFLCTARQLNEDAGYRHVKDD